MEEFMEGMAQVPPDYQKLAEMDVLTTVYNRRGIEAHINQRLDAGYGGTLFVLDMDAFKKVNDRYGHTVGDQTLKMVAEILVEMFQSSAQPDNFVGRIGGDEFVIFLSDSLEENAIAERIRQIENRFKMLQLPSSLCLKVSLTIAGGRVRQTDHFVGLFDRVDQTLLQKKAQKQQGLCLDQTPYGVQMDLKHISDEIRELFPKQGACCLDYETFKNIFRYEERRMLRREEPVNMILFTLADQSGDFPILEHRDSQMHLLSEVMEQVLRMGDLFTQYTSCQYLVMVPQTSPADTEKIAQRIQSRFYALREDLGQEVILHHNYPLKPAGTI